HGAEPLAAGGNQVIGDFRDHGDFRAGPRQDGRVDALHVGGDKLDQKVDRSIRGALEGYNNRHAGLHICRIRTILEDNNRKCNAARQGHEAVDIRVRALAGRLKGEPWACGNWFEPTTWCWSRRSARCWMAPTSIIWCWTRT